MTILLLFPAMFVLSTIVLWVLYLAVMHLKESRDMAMIPMDAMTPAKIVLFVGLLIDCVYHITWGTLVFLDIPREWLLTSRLERYQKRGGWRGKVAHYICKNLLDWADPDGCHCRPK